MLPAAALLPAQATAGTWAPALDSAALTRESSFTPLWDQLLVSCFSRLLWLQVAASPLASPQPGRSEVTRQAAGSGGAQWSPQLHD